MRAELEKKKGLFEKARHQIPKLLTVLSLAASASELLGLMCFWSVEPTQTQNELNNNYMKFF